MSDNVRIILALVVGLLTGAALTCAAFAIQRSNELLRELKRDRERRALNQPRPASDMPINQFIPQKAPVDRA